MSGIRPIYIHKIIDAQAIAKNTSYTSAAIDLSQRRVQNGYFALQFHVAGDGTCKFEYLLSIDGTNFLEPSDASDIASAQTKITGPGADGKDIYSFSPALARFLKIKCTETGNVASVTVTAWLAWQ